MVTFKVRYLKISVQLKPQCTIYYTSKKCFLLEKLLSVALYLFFSSDCILQILMFKQSDSIGFRLLQRPVPDSYHPLGGDIAILVFCFP